MGQPKANALITSAAILSALVGGVFLGFYWCGAVGSVRDLAFGAVLLIVFTALVLRHLIRRPNLGHQLLFLFAVLVVYQVGLRVGAALYMPPSSFSQVLYPGC